MNTGSQTYLRNLDLEHIRHGARRVVFLFSVAVTVSTPGVAGQVTLGDDRMCRDCRLSATVEATIGMEEGPGFLLHMPNSVAVDSRGRFWVVADGDPVKVFDSEGRFLRTVGGFGGGPGEYRSTRSATVVGDSVVILDTRLPRRLSVFDGDFDFVRSIVLRDPVPEKVLPLRWPEAVVVTGSARRPATAGWPFHLVDFSGREAVVKNSFGEGEGTLLPIGQFRRLLTRYLDRSRDGNFVAIEQHSLRITRWDEHGGLREIVVRDADWLPDGLAGGMGGTLEHPPQPYLADIHEDNTGRLWVVGRVKSRDFEDAFRAVRAREGDPPPCRSSGFCEAPARYFVPHTEMYESRVEVIDQDLSRVLVSQVYPGFITEFLSDGRVVVYREMDDGAPYIEIVRLKLVDGTPAGPRVNLR
ncbi:MAG: hypothetical protein WEA24_17990 [Gemmatimonadota bacterium]